MKVSLIEGKRCVIGDGKILAGPFASNAAAWRAYDRLKGEPVSRSEWMYNKQ
jgi:hypothetical protein